MTVLSLFRSQFPKIFLTFIYVFIANLLSLAFPWGLQIIIDDVLIRGDAGLLNKIAAGLIIVLVLKFVFNYLRKITSNMVGERVIFDLREHVYGRIHELSLKDIKKITPAQIMTRVMGDVESIRSFIFSDLLEFVYAVVSMAFIICALMAINIRLSAMALLSLPVFFLFYLNAIPKLQEGYRSFRNLTGELSSRIQQVLNGMPIVKAYNTGEHEKGIFRKYQESSLHAAQKNHTVNSLLWVGIDFLTLLVTVGILWAGGKEVIGGIMSIGQLMAFYSFLGMLFAPIIRLAVVSSSYQEASVALNRINEILTLVPQNEINLSARKDSRSGRIGAVAFEHVFFNYDGKKDVLKDINFAVKPGQTIGIVGMSGSGKTTMMSLLLRFYEPTQGMVHVDGENLASLPLDFYRAQTAVVLQDDYLFNDTIEANIRYGNFQASERQVQEAAVLAQAHDFIVQCERGYRTMAGEAGVRLSSGQRQRIALARAFLRDPSILILDEATSSLDAVTENKIQSVIKERFSDRIVFIVAHRFSTIMDADFIIVLDGGRVTEMGGHEILLKNNGHYRNLYFEQFKERDKEFFIST